MQRLCDWYSAIDFSESEPEDRFAQSPQIFRLFGYAGTGKTTCVSEAIRRLGSPYTAFAAFTGKAALVMTQKGTPATTVHRLIYQLELPDRKACMDLRKRIDEELDPANKKAMEADLVRMSKPHFDLNPDSKLKNARLLVLDECSMIGEEMGRDVLYFNTPVLVVGDPGQLPPIDGAGFFTDAMPDAMLEEIHRQAKDSPIIDLATRARQGRPLPTKHITQLRPDELLAADIIITGTNKRRFTLNYNMRHMMGVYQDPFPSVGERLICGKNNYNLVDQDQKPMMLLNGEFVECTGRRDETDFGIELKIKNEAGQEAEVVAIKDVFLGKKQLPDYWHIEGMTHLDFGYAITVHKSQGSQWDNVIFLDDNFGVWDKPLRRRWLYTGITRAAKQLSVYRV
jgi:exodeoxyribonuclease-5